MEWYGAFGIMVTLIWMYLEILRLLSKMRSRYKPPSCARSRYCGPTRSPDTSKLQMG